MKRNRGKGKAKAESSVEREPRPRRSTRNRDINYAASSVSAQANTESSSKWSDQEVETLLEAILTHGHLNTDAILEKLPGKNLQSYQSFMRALNTVAKKNRGRPPEVVNNLNNWLETCESKSTSGNSSGPLEIPLVLKLLSLDGVLENHPLPENAGGVDYGACYRVLYQAALGHPIQPVNKETVDAIYEAFTEVNQLVERNGPIMEKMKDFLDEKYKVKPSPLVNQDLGNLYTMYDLPKKPFKTYEKKKPAAAFSAPATVAVASASAGSAPDTVASASASAGSVPATVASAPAATDSKAIISLTVEPVASSSNSPMYSLKVDGDPTAIPLVLPERMEATSITAEEMKILQSVSYNPLGFPSEWLKNTDLKINYNSKKHP